MRGHGRPLLRGARTARGALGPARVGPGLRRVERVARELRLDQVLVAPLLAVAGSGQGGRHGHQGSDYWNQEQLAHGAHHLCVSGSSGRLGGARAAARGESRCGHKGHVGDRLDSGEARANKCSECDGAHTPGGGAQAGADTLASGERGVAADGGRDQAPGRPRAGLRRGGDRADRRRRRSRPGDAGAARDRGGWRRWRARASRRAASAGLRQRVGGGVAGAVRRRRDGRGRRCAPHGAGGRGDGDRGLRLERLPGRLRAGCGKPARATGTRWCCTTRTRWASSAGWGRQTTIWRCHVDASKPDPPAWDRARELALALRDGRHAGRLLRPSGRGRPARDRAGHRPAQRSKRRVRAAGSWAGPCGVSASTSTARW